MILIRNGRVIGPAEGLDIKADVVLDGGRIAKIIPAAGQGKDGRIGDTGDGGENGPDGARADDMGTALICTVRIRTALIRTAQLQAAAPMRRS